MGCSWEAAAVFAYCLLVAGAGTARGWSAAPQEDSVARKSEADSGYRVFQSPEEKRLQLRTEIPFTENDQTQPAGQSPLPEQALKGPWSPGGGEQGWVAGEEDPGTDQAGS